MDHQRAVGFPAQDAPAAHDDHASIRQEVHAQGNGRLADHDLVLAIQINGDDLVRDPVGNPESTLAPARRLAKHEAGHQDFHVARRRF